MEKIKLTITGKNFLEWYFESGLEMENRETKVAFANSIISQMRVAGFGSYSIEELFNECPTDHINGTSTEQLSDPRYSIKLGDLGFEYELDFNSIFELIKNKINDEEKTKVL